VTNLNYVASPTNGLVVSSTGIDAPIPLAGIIDAGLLGPTDKAKLNNTTGVNSGDNAVNSLYSSLVSNVTTNLSTTTTTTTATVVSSDGTDAIIPQAVASGQAGVMSGADKALVDDAVLNADTDASAMSFVIDEDSFTSNSATKVPTQQSVKAYVDANLSASDAMVFKGTIGTGGTLTLAAFNALVVYDAGWTYRVITAGTYKGVVAEVGDLFIATVDRASAGVNGDWTVVQTNIDGAVVGPASSTNSNVALFDGASGNLIKDSGVTISGSNTGDEANASTTVKGIIELATQTEVNTGTDTTRAVTPATLKGNLGVTGTLATTLTYTQLVGGSTSQVITHGIGNQFVQAAVYEVAGMDLVICEVELTSTTTTTLKFNVAPVASSLRVVIIG
jgi:hypothetical protein